MLDSYINTQIVCKCACIGLPVFKMSQSRSLN